MVPSKIRVFSISQIYIISALPATTPKPTTEIASILYTGKTEPVVKKAKFEFDFLTEVNSKFNSYRSAFN